MSWRPWERCWPAGPLLFLLALLQTIPGTQIDYGRPVPILEVAGGQQMRRRDLFGEEAEMGPPPPGVSSLTFVFDRTGSMNDDLNQVRQGAKGIFETVMKQRKKLIYNFVLVLFHDPDVDPPFITEDPDLFQQQLASVSVQGGGDCPEMTLSGIKKALEVSLPGSYIYVFTDARSKDFHLEDSILNLIQEKQSSVVFVMTGDCGNRSAPGYKVFERIAAASFGQVFHLEKSHVNTVLEYVRHAVAQRKVHILYEVREHGQTHTSLVPVDAFFSELTISLAGERDDGDLLSIALVDPQNRTIDKSTYEHEGGTIDLTNVKLIRIKNPAPGIWRVRTSSRLKHTLRIFGHGAIDFKYGFASRPVATIDLTHPRPIAGQSTFLLVNMTGLGPPGTVLHISLLDYHGRELYRNETRPHSANPFVYFVGPFIPPKGFFFVRVDGQDEQNYEFVRIAPTAISTVEVIGPRAYMAERHTANAYSAVNLSCSIESRAAFTVYWMFAGRTIGGPLFYQSTDTSTWTIDAVTPAHRGYYTCQVASKQGNHSAVTFLDSKEPPPDIITTRNESVLLRGTAFLHCRTQTVEQPRIQWLHNQSRNVGNSAKTYTYENGTLRILDAAIEDSGPYTCRARTSGGQGEATVWLTVMQAPQAKVEPRELFAAEGSTFNLSCSTEGRPRPEVTWFFRGARIIPDPKFFVTYKNDLVVSEMEAEDVGIFECRAINPAGSASDFANVQMATPPSILVSQNKQMLIRGDLIVLECRVTGGSPAPAILWFKDGRQLFSDRFMQIQDGRLSIRSAEESDAGTYACKAENQAGSEIKPLTLGIGSAPTIVPSAPAVYVQIERSTTLLCRAAGIPKPHIRWFRDGRPVADLGQPRYQQLPDDNLLIKDVQLEDQANFTCLARNEFGEQRKHTNVVVTGLVSPVLASLPAKMELIEGRELQINCIVLLGNPRPSIAWLKNGKPVESTDEVQLLSDGSLLLRNGSEQDSGRYACRAESPAGTVSMGVDVQLIMRPKMSEGQGPEAEEEEEQLVAKEGDALDIPCPVLVPDGQPAPNVQWTRDFVPLNLNSPEFAVLPNQTLRILRAGPAHSGRYTCTAVNQAGEAEKSAVVQVQTPPTIALGQSAFNLVQGDSITLPCDAQGEPKPRIRWFLNDQPFGAAVVDEDGGLVLEAVDERHQGMFKCVASNPLGSNERLISVTVHTAPVIEDAGIVRSLVSNESEWLELKCPATAFPPPERQWSWEGVQIDAGDHSGTAAPPGLELPANGSLLIRKLSPAHAGTYECHVSNMAGDDRIQYSLKVQTAPRIVTESTQNLVHASVGTSLDLYCRAIGSPEPSIGWERDNLPVLANNFSFVDPQGTLHFRRLRLEDSGEYTCRAKNAAGEAIRGVHLVVQVPPRMLESQPQHFTFVQQDVADISCLVEADPKPEIQWLWQGHPLTESSRIITFKDGALRIVNIQPEDEGYYTCRATNPAGQEDVLIRVSVINPPEMRDPEKEDQVAVGAGDIILLQCPVTANGPPLSEIRWFVDGVELPEQRDGIALSEDRRRLKVAKAGEAHSGTYKCVAENEAGEAEKQFRVDVMLAPEADESVYQRQLRLTEGQQVQIGCPVRAVPKPSIVWLLNTHQVLEPKPGLSSSARGVKLVEDRLNIDSVEQMHGGTYVCVASNAAGTLDVEVQVTVMAVPKLGSDQELLEAKQGGHVTLNCDLLNPDASTSITWLFNHSTTLPPNSTVLSGSISPGGAGSRLHIVEAQFNKHRGLFECLIRNSVGQSAKQFQLDILVPPKLAEAETPEKHENVAADQPTKKAAPKKVQLTADQMGELWCPIAAGNPPPDVQWLLNGQPLKLAEDSTELQSAGLTHSYNPAKDRSRLFVSGPGNGDFRYSCVVTNKAGTAQRDFHVQIAAPPKLLLATSPAKTVDEAETMEVYEGNSVTFECPLAADIAPESVTIQWLQNGRPIEEMAGTKHSLSADRTRLVVQNVRRDDASTFVCKVSNFAGETSAQFRLSITVPPQIDGPPLEEVTFVEGQSLDLQCMSDGIPAPSMTWLKDKRPIEEIPEHIELLNEKHFLYVEELGEADAGAYTCVAQNAIGRAEKTFNIRVILQPRIVDSQNLTELEVPLGQPITFECPLVLKAAASDVRIGWTRDQVPLSEEQDDIQLLEAGRKMTLLHATAEDAGKFACLAENLAGQARKEFKLEVLIPPKLKAPPDTRFRLIENQSLIISCETVEGVPRPSIEWTKDGHPLKSQQLKLAQMIERGQLQVLSEGQQLKLADAGADHAGEYACQASNKVGQAALQFRVQMVLRPALDGGRPVEAFEGQPLTLLCPLKQTGSGGGGGGLASHQQFGNFEINWFKDAKPLSTESAAGRISSIQSNLKLIFSRVNSSDEGNYACVAQNAAGESRANFQLTVLTTPRILVLEKEKNKTVIHGLTLLLSCPAEGKPEPEIRWRKEGQLLLAQNISQKLAGGARLAANGAELRVDTADSEAAGRFSCEARNRVGTAEQDFFVDVHVAPQILWENLSTEVSGPLGHPLSLACPVSGHPAPQIIWLKGNHPVEQLNDPIIYTSTSRQKLHFSRLQSQHLDVYTCLAKNGAGEDRQEFRLNLLEAPKIDESNLVHNYLVIAGRTVILECPVSASPEPTILWLKDGKQLAMPPSGRQRLLEGGRQLQISEAVAEEDAGSYTCLATNPVGSAELNVHLRVVDPPRIAGPPEETSLAELNKAHTIQCQFEGTQPMRVEWLFQDQLVAGTQGEGQPEVESADPLVQLSDRGHRLNLLSAQKSHGGIWTCVARNLAGEARKAFQLIVQTPPTIDESASSAALQSIVPGEQLQLDCIVTALPQPQISWLKDGQPLDEDQPFVTRNGNQTFWLPKAGALHDGRYTCVAENPVGSAQRSFMVRVADPPQLEGMAEEEVQVRAGHPQTVLQCRLRPGSGPAELRWESGGQPLEAGQLRANMLLQQGKLTIREVQLTDAGDYECVAENEAGQARKLFRLTVVEAPRFKDTSNTHYSLVEGQTVMLDCSVTGTPQPRVFWHKDGEPLAEDGDQYQLLDRGQMLNIAELDEQHVGRYSCLAENLPGRAEKDIVLSLLKAPVMADAQLVAEVAENETHTLECPLQAAGTDQSTEFEWTRNGGLPVGHGQKHIQFSASSRKLHFMKAHRSDTGHYTCAAKNAAGRAQANFELLVLVPPSIEQSLGYRTVEALANESVQLQCLANGIPTPDIEWFHDGRRLPPNTKGFDFVNNGTQLRILDVQMDTGSGRYSCVASNKVGKAEMDIFLEVIEPPSIFVPNSELNVVEGSEQRLECVVSGHPRPMVEWRRGGGELVGQQEEGIHAVQAQPATAAANSFAQSHFLHIRTVGQEHAGRYTCIATNKGGEVRQSVELNVLVPPSIEEGERLFRVAEGADLALECPARGVPSPTVVWRRPPANDQLDTEVDEATGRERLLLGQLTPADAGRYTCEASNEAGKASADFVVEVLVKPRILASPDNFQVRVVEGDKARMECRAQGNPEPTVRWLKAGRPLTELSNLILSPRADALMILKTRRTDAGKYTCRLENSVGEAEGTFTLAVLVGPHINETLDQNPRALKDQPVELVCPVQGLPTPEVVWLKDGQPLPFHSLGRYQREGTDLRIKQVQTEDAGRYTCRATNEVGQLNTEFELEVIAPPQFAAEGQRSFEAIEGEPVTMTCPVQATPFPEISWLHGSEPVDSANARYSADNKQLILLHAGLADGGKYVCRASNVAGHSEVDLSLRVLVPPQIDESNLVHNPLAILGKEIFLECPASGIPQPTVTWQREGEPIQPDGRFSLQQENQTLVIRQVSLEDQGAYACLVHNNAGHRREEFQLEVLVPPQMEEAAPGAAAEPAPVSKREGEVLQLVCPLKPSTLVAAPAKTEEELRVAWSKDGRPLEPEMNPNVEISEHPWRRLQLHNTSQADAGEYKCVASNRAGQSYAKFNVEILSKPKIDVSRNAPEPHVIAGRPITLWCPASANPMPTVRWSLNRVDISQPDFANGRYRLLDQGQGLEIRQASPDDVGIWTCQAENAAGTSTADISLDVWVEPTVRVLVEDSSPMKPIGGSITLLCEVHGNPEPVISWSLHEQTIIPSPGRVHISKRGQRLEIPRLRSEDTGDYYCIAQNEVGAASDFVSIEILVPPTISRETVELNPRLPLGRSLTLFCDVSAKPSPEMRWFLNGTPIDAESSQAANHLLVFGEGHRFLQIQNISLAQRGSYRCEASNAAGKDSIEYRVDVFEPPTIEKGGTEQVVEGRVALLECKAYGEPPPVIHWQRNGVLVETGVRYALDDTRLKVIDARSSDSGIYVCVATNEAGTDQQAFTLEVLIPPKVSAGSPAQVAVPQGGETSLKCTAHGYPQPQLHWSVEKTDLEEDFVPLGSAALRKGTDYMVEEGGTVLKLTGVQHDGTRHFRCSAVNSAGIDELDFAVSVVRPPMISREGLLVLNITEGDPMRVPCGVRLAGRNGTVASEQLQWMHNGKQMTGQRDTLGQGTDGSLTMEKVGLAQAGNYTCVVKNSAGNANATVLVNVGVPPKMSEAGERTKGRVIVEQGGTAELWCEAVGIPPPKISWFREEMPLNKFVPTAVTATENSVGGPSERKRTTAIFGDVRPEHAGVYTCVAENWAGRANKTVDLVVLVPPSIEPERDQLVVESGQLAVIHCNASGSPEPLVSWLKATDPPVDIVANERKYQLLGTSLAIRAVNKDDHGFYHCIARSEAGQAIGVRRVVVKLPLSEMRRLYVECDQNGVPIKSTYVRDRGDRPQRPSDYIHWSEEADLQSLPENVTDGVLLQCLPSNGFRGPRRVPVPASEANKTVLTTTPALELQSGPTEEERRQCPNGFHWNGTRCEDLDECATGSPCQHRCLNLAGTFRCLCPSGYSVDSLGRCVDLDECAQPRAVCASTQLCFNQLGTFACLDQPCPPKFFLDQANQKCVAHCAANTANCSTLPIHLHMLAIPRDLAVNTSLLRLTALDKAGRLLRRTRFQLRAESTSLDPAVGFSQHAEDFHFGIQAEAGGRSTLHNRRRLAADSQFRLAIRSSSNGTGELGAGGRWHSNYLVLIAVSKHPF